MAAFNPYYLGTLLFSSEILNGFGALSSMRSVHTFFHGFWSQTGEMVLNMEKKNQWFGAWFFFPFSKKCENSFLEKNLLSLV